MNNPIKSLTILIKNEDLKQYAGDSFDNLIKAVMFRDLGSGVDAARDLKQLLFSMPNLLFWDKMERFLYGTFHDYEDQIKFASRFRGDSEHYIEFVKRQVQLIDKIDEDKKVDYFAALTRAFLLECIEDEALYFKLAKFLTLCTSEELEFIKEQKMDNKCGKSMMLSVLYYYGLFTTEDVEKRKKGEYILSDFGKALKQYSLNDEEFREAYPIKRYKDLEALKLPDAMPIFNGYGKIIN